MNSTSLSLDQAAGLQGNSGRGMRKAQKREREEGHATPERPQQKSRRTFKVGSERREQARQYFFEIDNPQQPLVEAALKLKDHPKIKAAGLRAKATGRGGW